MFVNVVLFVGWGKHFALVNIIDSDGFKDLGLNEMTNTGLSHDGDSNRLLNFLDELWITHSGHTALSSDIGRDSLESHDGAGSRFFSDAGLFRGDHVHDDPASEHLRQPNFH
ncbi:hypothetical protein BN1843_28140 [Escherichia coli]|nr:hypothetical protein BN1843_28140 [Escherichia coli]